MRLCIKNTVVLIITTACFQIISEILGREIVLTKLDATYLFMLVFLCVNSLLNQRSN